MPKLTELFKSELLNTTIALNCQKEWQQEDIAVFKTQILEALSADLKEHHLGADRECFRFVVRGHYFNLQFDVYSQSCWIEAEDHIAEQYLETLFEQLNLR